MDDRTAVPAPVLAFPDPAIIFSGQTALDRLLGVATRATDGPRVGLERWGSDNATGIAHDHVGVIGTGTITIAPLSAATTSAPTAPRTRRSSSIRPPASRA